MNLKTEQAKFYKEVAKYNSEYKKAITKLLELDNINEVLSPLTAIIMQYIENNLKAILQDCFEIKQSAHDLHIDNHKCKNLLKDIKTKYEKYLDMDLVNNQFSRIEECINYMEGIYGENTMINARYPLDSKELKINRNKHTVVSKEYKLMFLILRYAIENLISFYEMEKTYQKIIETEDPFTQLENFKEFCNKEFEYPENIIKINCIKEIDRHNENVFNK